MTKKDVAREIGISERTMHTWLDWEEFNARVGVVVDELRARILTTGIADRVYRVQKLGKMADKLERVIDVVTLPDPALHKEYRETLKQAAQELGQWTEKREVTGSIEITDGDKTPAALITERIDELAAKRAERLMIDVEASG